MIAAFLVMLMLNAGPGCVLEECSTQDLLHLYFDERDLRVQAEGQIDGFLKIIAMRDDEIQALKRTTENLRNTILSQAAPLVASDTTVSGTCLAVNAITCAVCASGAVGITVAVDGK